MRRILCPIDMNRISSILFFLLFAGLCVQATEAPKGIFSVGDGVYVQIAAENYNVLPARTQWTSLPSPSADGWRVLTSAECSYLLASGRANASDLNALGTVDGQKGLIILPDGWEHPSGVPTWKTVAEGIDYDYNIYTASQWAIMAANGAVFLPCEGYSMDGSTPIDQTDHGAYWSSDAYDGSSGYCIRFNGETGLSGGQIHDCNHAEKELYYSVRLVREIPVFDEEDESAAYNTKLTLAQDNSNDFAIMRRHIYKDGYFNTLCLPFAVPSVATSPLAGAQVYAFDGGEVVDDVLQLKLSSVADGGMLAGKPYLLRWSGGSDLDVLRFDNIASASSWLSAGAADTGDENVKFHGFLFKTHINDDKDGDTHYNFFLGANDVIYWPTDGGDASAKMKGFRAHFYVVTGGHPSSMPIRRGMPAVLQVPGAFGTTTDIQNTEYQSKARKALQSGQVVLLIDGETYTIGGQKL